MLIGYICTPKNDETALFEQQLSALRQAGCTQFFHDQMNSRNDKRPSLNEAISYARTDDTIVVWKIECLLQNLRQFVHISESLREHQINLKILEGKIGDIDASELSDQTVLRVVSALADLQGKLISERTKAGLERLKAQGQKLGRPGQFDAWKLKLIEMKNAGYSQGRIHRETGLAYNTVKAYLKRLASEAQ